MLRRVRERGERREGERRNVSMYGSCLRIWFAGQGSKRGRERETRSIRTNERNHSGEGGREKDSLSPVKENTLLL